MRVLQPATLGLTLGLAFALGATGAHAQNVITRQIGNEPVETTVTQTPGGTVITRRPLASAPVAPEVGAVTVLPGAAPLYEIGTARSQPYVAYPAPATRPAPTTATTTTATTTTVDEMVGAAPTRRAAARTPTRVVHQVRKAERHEVRDAASVRSVARTVTRTNRRVAVARPLVLDPAQRQVVYRTIVQQQIVPPAGYPAFPAPAYPARAVMVPPEATTGYAVTTPEDEVYEDDAEQIPPAVASVRYVVGTQLPAGIAPLPLPATAAVAVPTVRPYSYVTVDNRVLLVDPATNTVVADITP